MNVAHSGESGAIVASGEAGPKPGGGPRVLRVADERSAGSNESADRRKILVVEDDEVIRCMIVRILSRERMDVLERTRSDEAIAILAAERVEAIVLDLMILPSGGSDVLAWMELNRPDLLERTVVVSAASPKEIERAITGRPCRYLSKPFDIQELASAVISCAR